MKRNATLLSLMALLFLGGCSLSPTLDVPSVALPASSATALHVEDKWWEKLGDASLNTLVQEALNNNDDIKLSALRILKAKQAYGLSDSNRYPSLNATAGSTRQKTSDEGYTTKNKSATYDDRTMALNLSYEIDFWGKLSEQAESNWSLYLASQSAAQTVRNTLIHDVIVAYLNVVSLNERLQLLDESIEAYKLSYAFRLKQQKVGTINELLASSAQAQYLNATNAKAALLEAKALQESALSILLGKNPQALFDTKASATQKLPLALVIPPGIPSTILESRPDIQEALLNLKSKNALIGVEKSAYFPSISLTGSLGQQSENLDNILKSSANRWSFGPSLSVPIFDFERIKTRVAITETDLKSSLISYEQTVKKAYKEVYDALAKNRILSEKVHTQEDEVLAYERILNISTKRFDAGVANHLEVLDAQKGLLNASINLVTTKQAYLVAQAELFKALGSGWNEKQLLGAAQ